MVKREVEKILVTSNIEVCREMPNMTVVEFESILRKVISNFMTSKKVT